MADCKEHKVSCELCKKEIPTSVVVSFEGADYTYHFCCQDCADHFFEKNPDMEVKEIR